MGKSDLYVGSDLIQDIYCGSDIISKVYRGSEEIYCVYYDGQIIKEQTDAGSGSVNLKVRGLYEVICVGAGGGSACQADQPRYGWKSASAGGGSGAYVNAKFVLTAGTYNFSVGAGGNSVGFSSYYNWLTGDTGGDTTFSNKITAGGGTGGKVMWNSDDPPREAGVGGTGTASGYSELVANTSGNTGTTINDYNQAYGGSSVYSTYGAGGDARATGTATGVITNGGNGYFRIRYLGHA